MTAAWLPENSGDRGSPGEIRQLSAGLPPAGLTGLFIDYKIFLSRPMKPSITRESKRKFTRRTFAGFRRPSLIAPNGLKTRRIGVAGALAILFWSAGSASADGLFVNGLGARARSMGGAFVALADDFSAIYWNPAGLALFDRKMIGISFHDSIQQATYQQRIYKPGQGTVPFLDAHSVSGSRFSGLAGGFYPIQNRWVVGLGIYSPTEFGITWNGADMTPIAASNPDIRWSGFISMMTIAPAAAFKITEKLFIGSSLCLNFGRFAFARYAGNFQKPLPEPPFVEAIDLGQYEENLTGWGPSVQLGVLYRPTARLSFGISFRTASTITFKGHAQVAGFPSLSEALQREIAGRSGVEKKITWPVRFDAGVAVRPMDGLVLTADLQWTRWSRLKGIQTNYLDPAWVTYMGERGNDQMPMFDRDAFLVKCGAELSLRKFTLRTGFSLDPAPISDDGVNLLFPHEVALGISLGAGFLWSGYRIEIGLDYLAPKNATNAQNAISVVPPSSGTIWEFWLPGDFAAKTLTLSLSVSRQF